ncbi:hypothetical protein SO694_00181018 [Aureococcus anophagefferens]|uniref:HORMA domain-containing protein n=1 Tax=Aureococcus anophagefferens TaxID=44056 RepID=A0ABR1FGD1_AURAN
MRARALAPDATVACLDDEEAVARAPPSRPRVPDRRVRAREIFPEQQFRITRTKQFKLLTRARAPRPPGPGRLLDGGVRESIAKRYARSLTLSINDEADRAHVALDKALTFFATVLPETTSAAASFTLKMAFNSTAPGAARQRASPRGDPAAYAFDAAVPNSIKLILGAVQGPRACELTYRGVQPLAIEEDSVAESAPPASGCFDLKLSDSLKDDDETQLDSARISPPKKKRRRGPEDHPSYLSSGIPVCSQDSVISSRSYGDDAYLF